MNALSRILSIAAASLLSQFGSEAQVVAVQQITGGFESPSTPDATYGWQFTVGNSDLSVTQLGLLDLGTPGFAESHRVGIWDSGNNLVTEVTFATGQSGTLNNGFRYLPVSPVTLQANQLYSVGFWSAGSLDSYAYSTTATFAPELSFGGASVAPGGGFAAPYEVHNGLNYGVFGANIEISPVPEPKEYAAIGGVSLLAFAAIRRWRMGAARASMAPAE